MLQSVTVANTQLDKPLDTSRDFQRYLSLIEEGLSVAEIAARDGITEKHAATSIAQGQKIAEMRFARELMHLRSESALDIEKQRKSIRKKLSGKVEAALATLLEGKRAIVEVDKITGKVTLHEITDPEILALGIEQFRKTTSMEEKPAAPTTVINNVQQNNTNTQNNTKYNFEDRVSQIRKQQRDVHHDSPVIDIEAVPESDTATEPESAPPEPAGSTEEPWDF